MVPTKVLTRRQLHRFEPDKGGIRRRYGGSLSIHPFRKADVVLWYGKLVRVGGYMDGGISLHAYTLKNKRTTQKAKPEDCVCLFNQRVFGTRKIPQFLPALKDGVSLGPKR